MCVSGRMKLTTIENRVERMKTVQTSIFADELHFEPKPPKAINRIIAES